MHVIGTAGHVDHGKSTLIASLTGINPDRLKEEQERLMTIDLGFAWLTLPSGEEVGIVDVPGHRDFVENMLAGIGSLDAVMLVIAADEGVMPQTREHLAIIDLLHIQRGIVVLTKIDLVDDPDWLDLVESDVRYELQTTVLQDAPIMRISSRDKRGFPELLKSLDQLLGNLPPRPNYSRPRLYIDRVFSMTGFGTIVTGTLSEGKLAVGDEVEILPSGLHARIRGLQTHKKKVDSAVPGSRLAINLTGVNVEQIFRGQVVALPGKYRTTQRLDVQFHLLADSTFPLHHHTEVKLYLGASETIASVRLLGAETINPGESGWLQLDLRNPIVAIRGDRYILRRPSPGETIGGGSVVDPQPRQRHKRFDRSVLNTLESLAHGSPSDVLLQACLALGPTKVKEAVTRSRLEESIANSAIQELLETGQLMLLDSFLITSSEWLLLKENIIITLGTFHKEYPLRRGMQREELKSRLGQSLRFFNLVMNRLESENSISASSKWVALPDHEVGFSLFQQTNIDKLMEQFALSPYAPPTIKECQEHVGEDVFNALLEIGDLLAISKEVVFRTSDFTAMVEKISITCKMKGQVSLAEVRDLFGTSRRYAQALLEYLDSIGLTIRSGDFRRLKTSDG